MESNSSSSNSSAAVVRSNKPVNGVARSRKIKGKRRWWLNLLADAGTKRRLKCERCCCDIISNTSRGSYMNSLSLSFEFEKRGEDEKNDSSLNQFETARRRRKGRGRGHIIPNLVTSSSKIVLLPAVGSSPFISWNINSWMWLATFPPPFALLLLLIVILTLSVCFFFLLQLFSPFRSFLVFFFMERELWQPPGAL